MTRARPLPVPVLALAMWVAGSALVGCGDGVEACQAYVSSVDACYEAAGSPSPVDAGEDICIDIGSEYIPYYECLDRAFSSADCTTPEGIELLTAEADACTP